MALEKPLYKPCITAHSPQRLEMAAASSIASMMIVNSVPYEIKKTKVEASCCDQLCCLNLDEVILSSSKLRDTFKNKLKAMKYWWEKCPFFGPMGSPLRCLVQECVSYALDHMDYYSHCPLFIFICQLCFTKRAGVFNQNSEDIIVKVEKRRCDEYASFLESFGLFQVEELLNTFMIFGNPKPLVAIVKNSPYLRSLLLRYNSCDYVLNHVGMFCAKLERFVIEDFFGKLCVSEKYLYKTFFAGRSKREVVGSELETSDLSFPNLSHVDVGRGQVAKEFLFYLNYYYYPRLRSLSCNSSNLCALNLWAASKQTTVKFIAFTIEDICLTSDALVNLNEEEFFKYFPNVKHITLTLDAIAKSNLAVLKKRVRNILPRFPSSITFHIPFESIQDEDLNEIFVPLFQEIGVSIKSLQLFLFRKIQVQLIWTLINSCPNLELLTVRCCFSDILFKEPHLTEIKLLPLYHLKSFSIILLEEIEEFDNLTNFLSIIDQILTKAPLISSLELFLPGDARDWIVNAVAKGNFNQVSNFLLCLHSPCDVIDVDFYVVLVEAMTSLKQLVLIGVSPSVLSSIKRVFRAAQLRIIPKKSELLVAFHGLHSKYRMERSVCFAR